MDEVATLDGGGEGDGVGVGVGDDLLLLELENGEARLEQHPASGTLEQQKVEHPQKRLRAPTYVVSTTADSRHETRQTKTEGDKCGSGDSTSKGRKPTKRAMNQAEDERTSGVSLSCISA